MPEAVIMAGANGAGKTTFARQLVPTFYPGVPFLNVDEVQTEGLAFAHPVAAGRELLPRLEELRIPRFAPLHRGPIRRICSAPSRDTGCGGRTRSSRSRRETPVSPRVGPPGASLQARRGRVLSLVFGRQGTPPWRAPTKMSTGRSSRCCSKRPGVRTGTLSTDHGI